MTLINKIRDLKLINLMINKSTTFLLLYYFGTHDNVYMVSLDGIFHCGITLIVEFSLLSLEGIFIVEFPV
jgi:hypothetical protein